MDTHPDPDQFVKELAAEDSALTGYLLEEVLNAQPPAARELLLSTSILEQVSAEAATELAGSEQAGGNLAGLGAREHVCAAGRGRLVPVPHVVRGGAAAQAAAGAAGPGAFPAPAGCPVA